MCRYTCGEGKIRRRARTMSIHVDQSVRGCVHDASPTRRDQVTLVEHQDRGGALVIDDVARERV